MAGKSPDKSEKQKSSGETTAGKHTVPKKDPSSARPGAIDPRTQFLDRKTSEDSPSKDNSPQNGTNTDKSGEGEGQPAVDSTRAGKPEDATRSDDLAAKGDTTGSPDGPAESADDSDSSPGSDDATSGEGAQRAAVNAQAPSPDSDDASASSGPPAAPGGPESDEGDSSSPDDAEASTATPAATDSDRDAEDRDGDSAGDPEATNQSDDGDSVDGSDTADTDTADATDSEAETEAATDSEAEAAERPAPRAEDATSGPGSPTALKNESGDDESEPRADDAGSNEEQSEPAARTGDEDDSTGEPTSRKGSATDQNAADDHPDKADAADSDSDSDSDSDQDDPDAGDADDAAGGTSGAGRDDEADPAGATGAAAGSSAGKDRGTTVLKALAKPEPAEPADPPAADTDGGGDSTSERKSQFVPLRSSDDPRATAPEPPRTPPASPPPATPPPTDGPVEAERTRQQPLPPVPGQRPLDLLAQLTNKPAPPETPVRTLVRRVKIWTPLLGLLALLVIGAQLLRPLPAPELELTAQPSHTFAGGKPAIAWPDSGQAALEVDGLGSLGTSGEQKEVPIASVAKTMTAYLLLRDHPMKAGSEGAKIKVDKQAEEDAGLSAQGESTVEVKEGETITQQEALSAVMIASANNVARLVARWDSDSEKDFVAKMNEAAEDLGMKNTTYTDPSGLRKETVSTAEDQVKLGKAVMKYEAFRDVVKLPSYEDRNGKKQDNWNRLVPLYGTVGIKTGTTTAAGGNLLFAAEKEIGGTKQLIIGAVLGQHQPPIIDSVLSAGRELIQSTQEALESETIIKKGTVVGTVDNQLGDSVDLVATKDVAAVGWAGLKVELDLAKSDKGVPHQAKAGVRAGTLTVGRGPGQVKVPVVLESDLPEASTGARLTRIG